MHIRRRSYPTWLKLALFGPVFLWLALWAAFPPPLAALGHVSPQVHDRHGAPIAFYTIDEGRWRVHTKREDIDPRFIQALLAVEDERFWTHSGVDPLSILRAVRTLIRSGKAKSGASTLTMQLVRQIEPRERILSSKIIESFRALQYNLALSKTQILEHYLTHISYGGNIQGLGAASHIYFSKTPENLTWSEIATLIALPQAPATRRPRRSDMSQLIAGRNKVLARLVRQNILTQQQAKEARQDPLNIAFKPLPQSPDAVISGLIPTGKLTEPVSSSLDSNIQTKLDQITRRYTKDWPNHLNGAAIIIHNPSHEIRAVHGAMAPKNDGGWMDLTQIKRSPGSTLKPFIYGLAMEDGLIDSSTLLPDKPLAFDGYRPENFDRRYYGEVRVHEALRHSLNIPAVAVMQQLGAPRFEAMLKAAGTEMRRNTAAQEKAGLAIALGGIGISPREIAGLYKSLANRGVASSVSLKYGATDMTSHAILSPRTADEITQILRYAPGPRGRVPHWLKSRAHAVSYKTGTSYGFRDAWAVGYTAEWTVLIWIGRPDGGAVAGQTGRNMAAPIMFDIFDALPGQSAGGGYYNTPKAAAGLVSLIETQPLQAKPVFDFPQDGTTILSRGSSRGVRIILSGDNDGGGGGDDATQLYVNGAPLAFKNKQWIWHPPTAGFYNVKAVNALGETSIINVRVEFSGA